MAIIGFSRWKQKDKYHFDIREGDVLRGKVLVAGRNFDTSKQADYIKNRELRKLTKKLI